MIHPVLSGKLKNKRILKFVKTLVKLPHSVPKGPKSGRASLKTRKGRASLKTREGLVRGKNKLTKSCVAIILKLFGANIFCRIEWSPLITSTMDLF
jgi:hypothetical protein